MINAACDVPLVSLIQYAVSFLITSHLIILSGMTSLDRRIDELTSRHSTDVQRLDRSIAQLEQLTVKDMGRRLEDVEGKLSIYDLISEQMSLEREKVDET